MNESFVGKLCCCSRGHLGFVTGREQLPWGLAWVGFKLDGSPWSSRSPTIVHQCINELLEAAAEPESG